MDMENHENEEFNHTRTGLSGQDLGEIKMDFPFDLNNLFSL